MNEISLMVVGTGTMGTGIARVAAQAGEGVLLYDAAPQAAAQARERIAASLARDVAKGRIDAATRAATLERLHPVATLVHAAEVALVVEAVREDLDTKRTLFLALERVVPPATALWTNTSILSIAALAEPLAHPARFCGVHFFNPVARMQLVELVPGAQTAPETLRQAAARVARWGKTAVQAPDAPGFIVNRILDGIKREALALVELGVPPAEVDTAVRLGLNFPMGPLELMDLIGLDTTLDVLVNQARAMGRPITQPTPLHRLVAEGKLGRKSGEGFYPYPGR